MGKLIFALVVLVLLVLGVQACNQPGSTPTPVPATATAVPPTATVVVIPMPVATPTPESVVSTPAWIKIASEGESFSFMGTVLFGEGAKWIQKNVDGAGQCTTAFFGSDPAPAIKKSCQVAAAPLAPTPAVAAKIVVTSTGSTTVTVTAMPTATVPAAPISSVTITAPTAVSKTNMGGWELSYYKGATPTMLGWKFELLVKDWKDFPNVDFKPYNFLAKDGLEYGMAESAFGQLNKKVDVNTAALAYRLITGDYMIPGIDQCSGDVGLSGCGIMLVNVGDVTSMFRNSEVDYGFTVTGRYWNGDAMPKTVWALLSHTAYNMLNFGGGVNAGANCSVAAGCKNLRLTFAILSGNELLMKGTTLVRK